MHIPLTFQLIIKRLVFFQTSSTFWRIPTNQPQHILSKDNNNSHHHHLPFLLLPSFHTAPPSLPPPTPSLFPVHHSLRLFLSSPAPCPLHLTSCKQHTSIILFLSLLQAFPFLCRRRGNVACNIAILLQYCSYMLL